MSKQNGEWADTLDAWKASRMINATLDSGRRVTMRKLTLDELVSLDALPDDLKQLAAMEAMDMVVDEARTLLRKGDKRSLGSYTKMQQDRVRLRDRLVLAAVIKPELTEADLPDLPEPDKVMIAAIAQGQIEFDAVGKRIGLEPMSTFRVLAASHHPGVEPEDCDACKAARLEISTASQ